MRAVCETLGGVSESPFDVFCVFFFSSRRRHTRLQGDWSSDVCSSDLHAPSGCHQAGKPGCRIESEDRKSTRLNSSHLVISYAVFCLKKKKQKKTREPDTTRTTNIVGDNKLAQY